MLSESNKIVLVDDDDVELDRLSRVFYDKGIGCRRLKYDPFYDTPLSNVHILFMDINLCNANVGDDKKRNATLKDALNLYISKENGPYALVFWTSDVKWKDSFLEFIKRDNDNLPVSPFFVTTMAKEDFSVEKIEDIFNESPVRILFEYEEEMSKSISNATNRILNTIPKDAIWGETSVFDANCKEVFSSIAVQNAGFEYAKGDSDRAVKEALIPIYADTFLNAKSNLWQKHLEVVFKSKSEKDLLFPIEYNVSELNAIFHLNLDTGKVSKECRGVVCPVDIQNNNFHDLFSGSFDESKDRWHFFLPPLKKKEDSLDAQIVCVELSASCDFSQNKERTNKYILGIMIPSEKMVFKNKPKDSILVLDFPIMVNEQSFKFCFNLNFTFTINKNNENFIGEPICQFKKELMDMIGNRYANHVSRIGITYFR